MTIKPILQIIFVLLLTVLTQIGGVIYLLTLVISKNLASSRKLPIKGRVLLFSGLYLLATFVIVPLVAPLWGREKIAHQHNLQPANYLSVLLNRNYVTPKLNEVLSSAAKRLQREQNGIQINYLDANFPFINGFALLPHLSHNDGKKIDVSLVYQNPDGTISQQQKSVSGYGVFVAAKPTENNQVKACLTQGHWLYDHTRFLSFGHINDSLIFSKQGTKQLLDALLQNALIEKVFIEPHLKQRLNLNDARIRFHGCHAVRHDDHIHLQISQR